MKNRNSNEAMTVFSLIDQLFAMDSFRLSGDVMLEVAIEAPGTTIDLCIGIHHSEATLADIVPLARAVSDRVCLAVQNDLRNKNQPISCRNKCSSCCYYMVPLSVPEVYYLYQSLKRLPQEMRDKIVEMCLESARKILSHKDGLETSYERNDIQRWYASLNLPCAFLSDDVCGIYEQRPLACREHTTTQSAALCDHRNGCDPEIVTMPVSVLNALGQLAATLEGTEIQAVMQPLAFLEMEDMAERSRRRWSSKMMAERFVEILTKQALNNHVEIGLTVID